MITPLHALRHLLLGALLGLGTLVHAQAPNTIWAYAVGDWRNGPVVTISPLFETTEAFTTPMLIAKVKKEFPEFKDILDIDVQRFATTEEGDLSRITLKGKYEARKLQVNYMPDRPISPPPAEPLQK